MKLSVTIGGQTRTYTLPHRVGADQALSVVDRVMIEDMRAVPVESDGEDELDEHADDEHEDADAAPARPARPANKKRRGRA